MDSSEERKALDLEELVLHPGTYFNPQTEVVVIVDDSISIDQEAFAGHGDADWIHIGDVVPVDSDALEEAVESFQTSYHPGVVSSASATALEQTDDDEVEPEPDLEPDPEDDE